MALTASEVNSDIIRNAKIFYFGTLSMTHDGNRAATVHAINTAKESGALISFDPNLREPLWESLEDAKAAMKYGISVCDILKISDNEIEFLTGEKDIDKGVFAIIREYGVPLVLATMGRSGSKAYCGGVLVSALAYDNPAVVDTTGAGDTFMGCALNYICENGMKPNKEQLSELLSFSNAAASLITGRRGALKVMPEKAEIDRIING